MWWKGAFKLPWREAGPPNHHDDKVDSDQPVVNKEPSLCRHGGGRRRPQLSDALPNAQRYPLLLHRNVQRFRGGLVFKAHRLGDSTPCRMTGVTLHGAVSPDPRPPAFSFFFFFVTLVTGPKKVLEP